MGDSASTILIIEDEPTHLAWMERILESEGYRTESAKDGREALQSIERRKYLLLVIDLVMPVMSGFEVLETLQREGIVIPTLIASGIIVPEIHHYLKTHPKVALLSKPLDPETFLQAIDHLTGCPPDGKEIGRPEPNQ